MSNKTYFALLGTIFSPFPIMWSIDHIGMGAGFVLFCLVIFFSWKYFKKADDI